MRKIAFVTGGNGDIGAAIVKELLHNNIEVISPKSLEMDLSNIGNIDDYFVITQQAGKAITTSSSAYGLQVKSAPGYTLVKDTVFVITCKLTDAGGLSDTATVSITVV